MRNQRIRIRAADLSIPLAGGTATILAAYISTRLGAHVGGVAVLAVGIYLAALAAFLTMPHLAIAGTVVIFALVPALKVFVQPALGGIKDIVDLAAISAAAIFYVFERRRPDKWVGILVVLLLALYIVNVGHGHNTAWAQGVRLMGEPLLLLLAGFIFPDPVRNLRYALTALIATACFVALYGLLQQVVGQWTLVSWGYSFEAQVRTIGSFLRSFGTLDDPFAYSAFLLFGIAAVVFWLRRGVVAWSAGTLLLLGLAASFVRTGVLVLTAYAGVLLIRWRHGTVAVLVVAAITIVAAVSLVNAGGTRTEQFAVYTRGGGVQQVTTSTPSTSNLALNGRISAWNAALGHNAINWLLGRGVGQVGTAAARAQYTFTPAANSSAQTSAVDSGYIATIADVGLLGLGVLLALFGRLVVLASRSAQRGVDAGWVALAFLADILIDALTRASFTGFPTAFLGLLLLGIALAAAAVDATSTSTAA